MTDDQPLIPAAMQHHLAALGRHDHAGRISGGAGTATFCTCGRAFFAVTVSEADNRQRVHEAVETGVRMTSWSSEDPDPEPAVTPPPTLAARFLRRYVPGLSA